MFLISGTFIWVNSKQPMTIDVWMGVEPDGGTGQNCAGTLPAGLADFYCNFNFDVICEFYN